MSEVTVLAYEGDEAFTFVSYAHEDAEDIYRLLALLSDEALHVWFDEGISPGNVWRDELADAIDRCGLFLFFVTPASVASRNCQRELGYALDSDKQVLAVHLEETTLPRGLTLSLADQQAILAYRYASADFALRLVEAIRNLLDADATTTQAVAGHHHLRRRIPTARLVRQLRVGVAIALPCAVLLGLAGGWLLQTELARGGKPTVEVRRLTDRVGLDEQPALSPSGDMVAFVAADGAGRQVWVRLLAGGAPIVVTDTGADSYAPRWSPDSSNLIYYTPGNEPQEHGVIWEVPALGGSARRVANSLAPGDISHNGSRIAYFRSRGGAVELMVADRQVGQTRRLAGMRNGEYASLRWSPDDRWLAYTFTGGGTSFSTGLFIVPADGGDPKLIDDAYMLQGIDWLPDGTGLVVSSARGSLMSYPPAYNLWTVALDDGASTQLTFGEVSYESPDVSADGLVLVSRLRSRSDVWRFPVAGDPVENVRVGERVTRQTGLVQTVSVSPDEAEVVFLSDAGGHANVWTARVGDGVMRRVTREYNPETIVAVPVWSPGGDWITFLSSRNSSSAQVTMWLTRPDGSEMHDLGVVGAWTCWSPQGDWLYYSVETEGTYTLRKLAVDGGEALTVRIDDALGCSLHGDTLYYAKVIRNEYGPWDLELRRAEVEDGDSQVLGRVSGSRMPTAPYDFQAVVSPDGAWLAMPLHDGSTSNLWTLSTRTGELRQVTEFGDRNVLITRRVGWSRDSAHLYASVSEVESDIVMLAGALGL